MGGTGAILVISAIVFVILGSAQPDWFVHAVGTIGNPHSYSLWIISGSGIAVGISLIVCATCNRRNKMDHEPHFVLPEPQGGQEDGDRIDIPQRIYVDNDSELSNEKKLSMLTEALQSQKVIFKSGSSQTKFHPPSKEMPYAYCSQQIQIGELIFDVELVSLNMAYSDRGRLYESLTFYYLGTSFTVDVETIWGFEGLQNPRATKSDLFNAAMQKVRKYCNVWNTENGKKKYLTHDEYIYFSQIQKEKSLGLYILRPQATSQNGSKSIYCYPIPDADLQKYEVLDQGRGIKVTRHRPDPLIEVTYLDFITDEMRNRIHAQEFVIQPEGNCDIGNCDISYSNNNDKTLIVTTTVDLSR